MDGGCRQAGRQGESAKELQVRVPAGCCGERAPTSGSHLQGMMTRTHLDDADALAADEALTGLRRAAGRPSTRRARTATLPDMWPVR